MSGSDVALIVLVVLIVLGVYAWWWSARLDRLHRRMDVTRAALETQLLRRAGLAGRLAGTGAFDPASSLVIADCASGAILAHGAAPASEIWWRESDLTHVIREALGDPADPDELESAVAGSANSEALTELADAWQRAAMAKTFYNDAVQDVIRLRSNPLIRAFRIAGRTPLPAPADFDIALPLGVAAR